jgi:hypothetical protein
MELDTPLLDTPELTQTASLKLIKNTKGYNWEIKILELDTVKLEKLNNEMVAKFGVKE